MNDAGWLAFLDEQHIESFYHNPRVYAAFKRRGLGWLANLFAPRGFSRLDGVDGPDAGDGIYVKQSAADAFAQVIAFQEAGKRVPMLLWLKANPVPHEFFHTCPDAKPTPEQLEKFSHPNELVPALRHAQRVQGAINAFTGLLRDPTRASGPTYDAAVAWFKAARGAPARQ
jgi:hypothetical protein